jgi:hypothetical protein
MHILHSPWKIAQKLHEAIMRCSDISRSAKRPDPARGLQNKSRGDKSANGGIL